MAIGGKPGNEIRVEGIEIVRIPVVEQVPYNRDLFRLGGLRERLNGRKIESPPIVHQIPAYAVSGHSDSQAPQPMVVFADMPVVLGKRYLIDTA